MLRLSFVARFLSSHIEGRNKIRFEIKVGRRIASVLFRISSMVFAEKFHGGKFCVAIMTSIGQCIDY